MNYIEQRARELFAAELEKQNCPITAEFIREGHHISSRHDVDMQSALNAVIAALSQQQAVPNGWRQIAEAPENHLCVVGWVDGEDGEERHAFDYIEDGLWVNHQDCIDHADAVAPAGSQMPARNAPYRWFIEMPAMLAARPEVQG